MEEAVITPITQIDPERFRTVELLEKLVSSKSALAALAQGVLRIPSPSILINTLTIQEAKRSSEIEAVVTTYHDLLKEEGEGAALDPAAKEVSRYRVALEIGMEEMEHKGYLSTSVIIAIANKLNGNDAGIRRVPGTVLIDKDKKVVHKPPQDYQTVVLLMSDLERFLNDQSIAPKLDPLMKMALAHWQFESIHPFLDGNGRAGRIMNVLYLVHRGLLPAPVLYLSRPILARRAEYYRSLQDASQQDDLESLVGYFLEMIESAAIDTLATVEHIDRSMREYKHGIRSQFRFYSQDLINMLFLNTYLSIARTMKILGIARGTATKYLEAMREVGLLTKVKVGKTHYFVNKALWAIFEEDEASL